jgi:hypothetical protein
MKAKVGIIVTTTTTTTTYSRNEIIKFGDTPVTVCTRTLTTDSFG